VLYTEGQRGKLRPLGISTVGNFRAPDSNRCCVLEPIFEARSSAGKSTPYRLGRKTSRPVVRMEELESAATRRLDADLADYFGSYSALPSF